MARVNVDMGGATTKPLTLEEKLALLAKITQDTAAKAQPTPAPVAALPPLPPLSPVSAPTSTKPSFKAPSAPVPNPLSGLSALSGAASVQTAPAPLTVNPAAPAAPAAPPMTIQEQVALLAQIVSDTAAKAGVPTTPVPIAEEPTMRRETPPIPVNPPAPEVTTPEPGRMYAQPAPPPPAPPIPPAPATPAPPPTMTTEEQLALLAKITQDNAVKAGFTPSVPVVEEPTPPIPVTPPTPAVTAPAAPAPIETPTPMTTEEQLALLAKIVNDNAAKAGFVPNTPVQPKPPPYEYTARPTFATPEGQALSAEIMGTALSSGSITPEQVTQNAANSAIQLPDVFGANPVSGIYTPPTGQSSATDTGDKTLGGNPSKEPSQPVQAPSEATAAPPTPPTPPAPATPAAQPTGGVGPTPRPISPAVQSLLDIFKERMNAAPFTSEQVSNSPEYQAQKRVLDFNRQQAQAALRRGLASRNMLRSTPAIQTLTSSDAYYTGQEDALVPQMLTAATARQRQSILDAKALLDAQMGVENTAFNQGVTQFNTAAPYNYLTKNQEALQSERAAQQARETAADRAAFTGVTLLPQDKPLMDEAIAAKDEYERLKAQGVVEPDTRLTALGVKAAVARAKLKALGYTNIDELIGAGVTASQAQSNAGNVGYGKTVTAKEKEAANAEATANAEAEARAKFTGTLLLPKDKALVDEAIAAKSDYEQLKAQGVIEPDPRLTALGVKAAAARAKLKALGYANVDELIGAAVTAEQAKANAGKVGYTKPETAKDIYDAEIRKIEQEIATSPTLGLKAEAQAKMDKLKADTDAALRRNTDSGLTPYQQYQIIRDATQDAAKVTEKETESVEKARESEISQNVKDYKTTRTGAVAWQDFKDIIGAGKNDGTAYTAAEEQQILAKVYADLPGPDKTWVATMYYSARGNSDSTNALNTTLNRNPAKPSATGTGMLDQ